LADLGKVGIVVASNHSHLNGSIMKWQPIETFKWPTVEWEWSEEVLVYNAKTGQMVVATALLMDAETNDRKFQYSREGLTIEPTHWMPLPEKPT
jgi:hypothetical protein